MYSFRLSDKFELKYQSIYFNINDESHHKNDSDIIIDDSFNLLNELGFDDYDTSQISIMTKHLNTNKTHSTKLTGETLTNNHYIYDSIHCTYNLSSMKCRESDNTDTETTYVLNYIIDKSSLDVIKFNYIIDEQYLESNLFADSESNSKANFKLGEQSFNLDKGVVLCYQNDLNYSITCNEYAELKLIKVVIKKIV